MGTFFQNGRRGDMTAARARNREESNLQGLPQTISNRINLPVKTIPFKNIDFFLYRVLA